MSSLINQTAAWLFLVGLLGLVLGWWLGRRGGGSRIAQAQVDWQQRLSATELEAEDLRSGHTELTAQLDVARAELERAQKRTGEAVAGLTESERLLAEDQQRASRELDEREAEIQRLEAEIERWREEHRDLERTQLRSREDLDRLTVELAASRDRIADLEAAVARGRHQLAEIERTHTPEADVTALTGEVQRLRQVRADFQEWMLGEARREGELEHARRQLGEIRTERDAHAAEASALRDRLSREQARVAELESGLGEVDQLRADLAHRNERVSDLEAHVASKAGLEEELEQLRGQVAAAEKRARTLEDEVRRGEEAVRNGEERAAQAAHRAARAEQLLSGVEERAARAEERAAPAGRRIAGVEERAASRSHPASWQSNGELELLEAPRGAGDELRKIRGIGTVLEQTLNRLGVYHYRQIAAWTAGDIEWVTSHIEIFPGRIERDGWVEQAARLHREHYGDEDGD